MIPAIIPAAGLSLRMGSPKPLLPIEGEALLERIIRALARGGAGPILAVIPPRDRPESRTLEGLVASAGAICLIPETQPLDMRASVELGLRRLELHGPPEGFLLTPADAVGITPEGVAAVIRAWSREPGAVHVPMRDGHRGHPVALPGAAAEAIRALPPDRGINAITRGGIFPIRPVEVAHGDVVADLDTPADYNRWISGMREGSPDPQGEGTANP